MAAELISSALYTTPMPPHQLLQDAVVRDGEPDHNEEITIGTSY